MQRLFFFLALIFWSTTGACHERVEVSLGGRATIVVPVPDGFRALGDSSPEFRKYSEQAQPPSTVLIETFLTENDLKEVLGGHSFGRDRELNMVSFRAIYGRDIDIDAFNRGVAYLREQHMDLAASEREMNKFASSHKEHYGGEIPQASQSVSLGTFLDRPNAVGSTICMFIKAASGSEKHCVAQLFLYIKDRAVVLNVASRVEGAPDIKWVIDTAKVWGLEILAAN